MSDYAFGPYQIQTIKREYDHRHELVNKQTGHVERGPTHTRDKEPPEYMKYIQGHMNREWASKQKHGNG